MEALFDAQREAMVIEQLASRGIDSPRVLDVFRKVKRHHFVPEAYRASSYGDHPLPIGHGQTISQPYMVALMTELLELKKEDQVLEIGTGSGYQAAILAELCGTVYTVERDAPLAEKAEKVLAREGYKNILVKTGDGTKGWEEKAPFDAIIVTAASPGVPQPLKDQLADGGRMVIPVGPPYTQTLLLIKKKDESFKVKEVCGCVFVPLVGEHGWDI